MVPKALEPRTQVLGTKALGTKVLGIRESMHIENTVQKNGDEETVVLNEPKKDAKNYLVDVGGSGNNRRMLSYALMDETIGTLHPRVDVYVENFEDSGRNKVLFKEKLPLGIRTGRHCCPCCPEDASRSDLPTEFGIGVELYFQFLLSQSA